MPDLDMTALAQQLLQGAGPTLTPQQGLGLQNLLRGMSGGGNPTLAQGGVPGMGGGGAFQFPFTPPRMGGGFGGGMRNLQPPMGGPATTGPATTGPPMTMAPGGAPPQPPNPLAGISPAAIMAILQRMGGTPGTAAGAA